MNISGYGSSNAMRQLMASRAGVTKTNAQTARPQKAKGPGNGGADSDGDNDGSAARPSGARESGQSGGINLKQLAAAINAGLVNPTRATPGQDSDGDSDAGGGNDGDADDRNGAAQQAAQAGKTQGAADARQAAASVNATPAKGAATGDESAGTPQSKQPFSYTKGSIVSLTA